MKVLPTNRIETKTQVTAGSKQPKPQVFTSNLKKLFKQGKIDIKYGLYGDELTIKNVSDEHIKPRSWGGKTTPFNIALASKEKNNLRGNQPLSKFLTQELLDQYVNQFLKIKNKYFDGEKYVKGLLKTIAEVIELEKHL